MIAATEKSASAGEVSATEVSECGVEEKDCEHWRQFDRHMIVARVRWLLQQEARAILLQQGNLTAGGLRDQLVFSVGRARPRSRLVAWNLPDSGVEAIIGAVVRDLCLK